MPHDQAYILAEKKIEEALKSGATELESPIHLFVLLFLDGSQNNNKGGNNGT